MSIHTNSKIKFLQSIYFKQFLGLVLATIIYFILNFVYKVNVTSIDNPIRSVIQGISYILIPLIWYIFIIHEDTKLNSITNFLSTKKGRTKKYQLIGFIEGNVFYVLISLPLFLYGTIINKNLFRWFNSTINPDYLLFLVYAIISVTSVEFVSKSYVMIPLLERNLNKKLIYSLALIVWTLGHIVEYIWLVTYIPSLYTIFILIQAGIFSIFAVLRSENVYGVWSGHILLNVFIIVYLNI